MNKKLLKSQSVLALSLMTLVFNFSHGQQTVGQFPEMDGGFEKQTITTLNVITPNAKDWTISTSPSSITRVVVTDPSIARSGNKYISFSNAATGSSRLQSPIAAALAPSTQYTVQYYVRAAVSPLSYLTGAIYFNTTGTNAVIVPNPATFVANTWIKASATFTSSVSTLTPRFASARINGITNTTDIINVDDFVVYAGPLDETAPEAPSLMTVSGLSVSWTAPVTGVDGGGYVVVRYASSPNNDNRPKQNGIYQVGNTMTEGTGSLVGTVVYVGTSTSFSDVTAGAVSGSDFYRVYSVDKAFNYSTEATLNTKSFSVNNPIIIYPNPVKHDQFSISLPVSISGEVTASIYNISGQLVYKTETTASNSTIVVRPTQSLKAGVYFIIVESDGYKSTQKITVI